MGSLRLSIHPLFFAFGVYYALTGKIFIFLIYTLVALLHELGHSFIADRHGYKLNKITLMPYGAVVSGKIDGLKPSDEIAIALAGPVTNILIAVFFAATWWVYPLSYAYTDTAAFANITIAVINLLPVFPLDGGRILLALLSTKMQIKKAETICKILSAAVAAALMTLFIISLFNTPNISLAFFAAFVIFGVFTRKKDSVYIKLYTGINPDALKRGMPCKKHGVSEEMTLKKLISVLDPNAINEVEVYRNGKVYARLSAADIFNLTENNSLYARLKDVLHENLPKT